MVVELRVSRASAWAVPELWLPLTEEFTYRPASVSTPPFPWHAVSHMLGTTPKVASIRLDTYVLQPLPVEEKKHVYPRDS